MKANVKLIILSLLVITLTSCELTDYYGRGFGTSSSTTKDYVTMAQATNAQHIDIHFRDRSVHLGKQWFEQLEWGTSRFDHWYGDPDVPAFETTFIVRSFMHEFPEDQALEYHYEAFGLQFKKEELLGRLDSAQTSYISDETFEKEFLQTGVQDSTEMRFMFWQSYVWGLNKSLDSELTIDAISRISGLPGQLLVEGRFHGDYNLSEYAEGPIVSGDFAVIISN